jgi:hypothetical protein
MKLQQRFLEELKKSSHHKNTFADEIAALLHISPDSAYRRIRGETVLGLEEVQKLCNHYRVSIDSMLAPKPETVVFRHRAIGYEGYTILDWLKSLMRNLEKMTHAREKNILHSGKEIPLLYYFQSREMAAFKIYFWMKSMFLDRAYQSEKFRKSLIPEEYLEVVDKVWEYYSAIDSTEIWTEDSVNVTLNQIEFYHSRGFFEDAQQGVQLCDLFSALLQQVREWASAGSKGVEGGKLMLYKNEILFADNTVLFRVGHRRIVFIPHSMIEVISTTHESYCEQTEKDMLSYIDRSELISVTGEKERNKFFNAMQARIRSTRERVLG